MGMGITLWKSHGNGNETIWEWEEWELTAWEWEEWECKNLFPVISNPEFRDHQIPAVFLIQKSRD